MQDPSEARPTPERREKPPAPGPARQPVFRRLPEGRLDNGLRVLLVTDRSLPRASIYLGWPLGRVGSDERNLALIPLAISLVDRGTTRRDARRMAEALDRYAIQLETENLAETTYLKAAALSDFLDKTAELMSEMVREASFPDDEVEKARDRMASGLIAQKAQPAFLARERAMATLFPDHPYSRVAAPLRHVQESRPEEVRDAFSASFGPAQGIAMIAGPLDFAEAMELARKRFDSWSRPTLPAPSPPTPGPLDSRQIRLVHRPHSVQARILVGGHAPARPDPGLTAFRVANQILGGSGSSRLFINLRESKGYTYGAYSSLLVFRECSCFLAGADVASEVAVAAILEILEELRNMSAAPPTADELTRAKAEIEGGFFRQMETPDSIGYLEMARRLHDLPDDYYEGFVARVEAVTAERTVEISRRCFDPERVAVTVVGDRDRLGPALEALGPLEVYDSQGEKTD